MTLSSSASTNGTCVHEHGNLQTECIRVTISTKHGWSESDIVEFGNGTCVHEHGNLLSECIRVTINKHGKNESDIVKFGINKRYMCA